MLLHCSIILLMLCKNYSEASNVTEFRNQSKVSVISEYIRYFIQLAEQHRFWYQEPFLPKVMNSTYGLHSNRSSGGVKMNRIKRSIIHTIKAIFHKKISTVAPMKDLLTLKPLHQRSFRRNFRFVPTYRPQHVLEATWVSPPKQGEIPRGAFIAGKNGILNVYVARSIYSLSPHPNFYFRIYDAIPASLTQGDICAMTAIQIRWAKCMRRYEILLGHYGIYMWAATRFLEFLKDYDPVFGGWMFPERKANYVCRVFDSTSAVKVALLIGHVNPYNGFCWVALSGDSQQFPNFDVLVYKRYYKNKKK